MAAYILIRAAVVQTAVYVTLYVAAVGQSAQSFLVLYHAKATNSRPFEDFLLPNCLLRSSTHTAHLF